jgi:hypothetical protein
MDFPPFVVLNPKYFIFPSINTPFKLKVFNINAHGIIIIIPTVEFTKSILAYALINGPGVFPFVVRKPTYFIFPSHNIF